VCDAWRVDLNLARHGSALPRVSYYIPLHTAPRLRCQLSKQNRMDFQGLSPRARVNLWIVNFSLTAYAGVLLGLLACLIRDQIKSSNQIKCGKSFEDAMSHAYLFLRRILRTLREICQVPMSHVGNLSTLVLTVCSCVCSGSGKSVAWIAKSVHLFSEHLCGKSGKVKKSEVSTCVSHPAG
jgi:hypothetical protein